MQYLPWIIILILIYAIYFLMIKYEKRINVLGKLVEKNRADIKENRKMIEKNKEEIQINKENINVNLSNKNSEN
ncbi:hypothetical protein [Campylobacter suis]|uniref:Flagellar biosynthesis protein n=1 Tax=Campylobacter suis TaxID=2790657 RepID=A0ABN7K9K5_9BACT|nr:hypothetical protein [Campylobacter suis]CAD7288509.1 hypothetical protein LMG8286_01353 [Campylobacter suis]